MPRLQGVNLLGMGVAALVMFFVGFVFYGLAFSEQWMAARGYVPEQFEGQSGLWMAGGFLIELVLAFAIGWVMKLRGTKDLAGGIGTGVILAVSFAFPLIAYEFVYGAYHSLPGLMVDWGHALVAFMLGGAVLSFFD